MAVFGHSFVRRLRDYLVPLNLIDMNLTDVSVIFHGVGGLTFQGPILEESQVVVDVSPISVVVDLGANDLDQPLGPDPVDMAELMFKFLIELRSKVNCKSVVIMQAFHRLFPRRHDFNEVLPLYNQHLKALCRNHPDHQVKFFPLKNIILHWDSYLLPDGVHFNPTGMQRYMRNVRGAVLASLK